MSTQSRLPAPEALALAAHLPVALARVSIARLAAEIERHRESVGERARVTFVLHPGGAAGAYQAGALAALAEEGVVPDLIVGTSIGAFNGLGFWLDELTGRPPGASARISRLGKLWRRLGHRAQASRLLLDKPFLLGWFTGRPDWHRGLAGELAGHLGAPGEAWTALSQGLFTTERLAAFTRRIVGDAVGLPPGADARSVGAALAEASAACVGGGPALPDLVVVATDVAAHGPCAFVLGRAETTRGLRERGWQAHQLGDGRLVEDAVLDVFYASASIPAVFPAVRVPLAPAGPPHQLVDGVVGNHRPFQLAVDAGATLIVSLEVESAFPASPYRMASGMHFVAAAAEAFMTLGDTMVRDSARELALTNRGLARSEAARDLVVPLYRLAPERRVLGLLDFDGHYEEGRRVASLYDGFIAGYAEAGGHHDVTWRDYLVGPARHGDTGRIQPAGATTPFVDATLAPPGLPHGAANDPGRARV